MTAIDLRSTVLDVLASVAPDMDPGAIDPAGDLREQLDLDSMDFLNVMIALHEALGVDIPEADYPQLASLDAAVDYLDAALRRSRPA